MTALDAGQIRAALSARGNLDRIEVFSRVDSTNTYLKDQPSPPPGQFCVAIAEHQTAGRGRHDRRWISAPGKSLCLSFSYRFVKSPDRLQALTLVLGVALARVLQKLGVVGVALKWPNDILIGRAKLGGILTETQFRSDGDITVIIGVGLNIHVPETIDADEVPAWAESATGLSSVLSDPPTRRELSGLVIDALFDACDRFETGSTEFVEEFSEFDALAGQSVVVETPDEIVPGVARGVDDDGALLIDTDRGETRVVTGSVKHIGNPGEG